MKHIIKIMLAMGLFTFMFVACNSSRGDSESDEVKTYDLQTDKLLNIFMDLKGKFIDANTTASFYEHYFGDQNQSGILVNIRERILTISSNTYNNGEVHITYFGYHNGGLYSVKENQITCALPDGVDTTPLPTQATVGYLSTIRLDCDNGDTMEVEYKLEEAEGNQAKYTILRRQWLEGAAGFPVPTNTDSYNITPDMNIDAYTYSYSSGPIVIDLEATAITVQ